ncbi:MAG: hypothetical protein MHPSP_002841, partial [Paramarteilia canceri]
MSKAESKGIQAAPLEDDLFVWNACIIGPENTPYQEGTFELEIKFPSKYPVEPPKVNFITPIFHPNVYTTGEVCLDILEEKQWNPMLSIEAILISVQNLLGDPYFHSAANTEASELLAKYPKMFNNYVESMIAKQNLEAEQE